MKSNTHDPIEEETIDTVSECSEDVDQELYFSDARYTKMAGVTRSIDAAVKYSRAHGLSDILIRIDRLGSIRDGRMLLEEYHSILSFIKSHNEKLSN